MTCSASDLVALSAQQSNHTPERDVVRRLKVEVSVDSPARASDRIDLHGMRVHEALEAIEKALDGALLAGIDRLEVIHGLGGDRIRRALHDYFAAQPLVRHFKLAEGNPGATWVYL
jgi:DNA mismatch repair protein MutS2